MGRERVVIRSKESMKTTRDNGRKRRKRRTAEKTKKINKEDKG